MRLHFISIVCVLKRMLRVNIESNGRGVSFRLSYFYKKKDYRCCHLEDNIGGRFKLRVIWSENIFYHNCRLNTVNYRVINYICYVHLRCGVTSTHHCYLLIYISHLLRVIDLLHQSESKLISTPEK